MLIEGVFEEILPELGSPSEVLMEEVIPDRQPILPTNSYRNEYAWQFGYERGLMRRASRWVEGQRHDLIGAKGLLSEALSNAYVHGNERNGRIPIGVELHVGACGYVFRISQSRVGFDVARLLDLYRRRCRYFHVAGNGLRRFDESEVFGVFFAPSGMATHLWYDSRRLHSKCAPRSDECREDR